MHLLLSEAGGFEDAQAYDIRQSSGDIVILSHAASELKALAQAMRTLQTQRRLLPSLRLMHLGYLSHPASIDQYLEQVVLGARIVIVRILGGKNYWDYGVREFHDFCRTRQIPLLLLAGDMFWDEELAQLSLADAALMESVFAYFCHGGVGNLQNLLLRLGHHFGDEDCRADPPRAMPDFAHHRSWHSGAADSPTGVILFYRALTQSGDTAPIDALGEALQQQNITAQAYAVSNFKQPEIVGNVKTMLREQKPDIVILATGFTLQKSEDGQAAEIFAECDVPLLQIALSGLSLARWQEESYGLPPKEIAMNVALTEIDGRIFTRAIAFQSPPEIDSLTECPLAHYQILPDRIEFVAKLARNWVRLKKTPMGEKKLAFVLGNYPASDGRLANGVGLDTPDAVVTLLKACREAGIACGNLPENSDALMSLLQQGPTNQAPRRAPSQAQLPLSDYQKHFTALPDELQQAVTARWGSPDKDAFIQNEAFHLPVVMFASIALGLQPARGYDLDPDEYCHDPALVPPHGYLAFYIWLREIFAADCLAHIGKHGTLEWLPGKSLALSAECLPDAVLGAMPVLYPFIANDPGEGTQAKRRTQAVILDHLPPALQSSGLYGEMETLELLMDEYYEARHLDAGRKKWLEQEMLKIGAALHIDTAENDSDNARLTQMENYLCDIKFTMIRQGLHRYGQLPDALDAMLLALVRHARGTADEEQSLLQTLAREMKLDFDPLDAATLTGDSAAPAMLRETDDNAKLSRRRLAENLEAYALRLIAGSETLPDSMPASAAVLGHINDTIRPLLTQSAQAERDNFLHGLAGKFIPPGPSGAPSRGRLDVLPTGRNFFSLDSRALPSISAWELGARSAELLLLEHRQTHGEDLREAVLSLWGTAQMRTGGEDIAQAMALMGVKPSRQGARVTGYEILPLPVLGRPRVDVTLRISGLFRDVFPNVVMQLARIVKAVANLDESDDMNPLKAHAAQDYRQHLTDGISEQIAQTLACQRIFGAQPGTYGTGLQHLIANGNWRSDEDFAKIFLEWGGFAYDGDTMHGDKHPELLRHRLTHAQAVLHNQDNREHDILDSDDYYQFSGGLAASVRHFSGRQPVIYHNDHSNPAAPKIGTLDREIDRIIRARAANPKWLKSIMRHGYKGAFEIAATVEYLFAFAATAKTVKEHHFDALFQAYLEDDNVREFMQAHNPQALEDMIARFEEAIARGLWQPRRNSICEDLARLAKQS